MVAYSLTSFRLWLIVIGSWTYSHFLLSLISLCVWLVLSNNTHSFLWNFAIYNHNSHYDGKSGDPHFKIDYQHEANLIKFGNKQTWAHLFLSPYITGKKWKIDRIRKVIICTTLSKSPCIPHSTYNIAESMCRSHSRSYQPKSTCISHSTNFN